MGVRRAMVFLASRNCWTVPKVSENTARSIRTRAREPLAIPRATSTLFGNVGVSVRVNVLAGLGLLALLALWGFDFAGGLRLDAALMRKDAAERVRALAGEVEIELLAMRAAEGAFLFRGDVEAANLFEKHGAKALVTLQLLRRIAEAEPARTHIDTVNDGVAQHVAQFRIVAETRRGQGVTRAADLDRLNDIYAYVKPSVEGLRAFANDGADTANQDVVWTREAVARLGVFSVVTITVLFVGFALAFARSIAGPVVALAGAASYVAKGDTETVIPALANADEIGDLARALDHYQATLADVDAMRVEHAEAIAGARAERDEDRSRFERTVARATGDGTDTVLGAAAAVEAAAAGLAGIADVAAREAVAVAEAADQACNDVAADRIGEVVGLVGEIADQTHLLALNATIEAARAGDAGKGFSVVASEVKNLANQTAKATKEIGSQVGDIQAAGRQAVAAIAEIAATVIKINEIVAEAARAFNERGAETGEVARNLGRAAEGTRALATNASNVASSASKTGAAAEKMVAAAAALSREAQALRERLEGVVGSGDGGPSSPTT